MVIYFCKLDIFDSQRKKKGKIVSTLQLYFIANVPKTNDEFEMPHILFQEHIYIHQYIREC